MTNMCPCAQFRADRLHRCGGMAV